MIADLPKIRSAPYPPDASEALFIIELQLTSVVSSTATSSMLLATRSTCPHLDGSKSLTRHDIFTSQRPRRRDLAPKLVLQRPRDLYRLRRQADEQLQCQGLLAAFDID